MILRRRILASGAALLLPPAFGARRDELRGALGVRTDGRPVLRLPGGERMDLEADPETTGVLTDGRLSGADVEVLGQRESDRRFRVDPIQASAIFVYRDRRKWRITYWCDVCSIRTYCPGKCTNCQKETDLDLRDPDER